MNKKYLIGGAIILIFFIVMGYLLSQSSIAYENDFSKIKKADKTFRATGFWIKDKGYKYDKDNNTFSFWLKDDKGVELFVIYSGSMPNNFESASSVVVTGNYNKGVFDATDILTKCPSKYEERFNGNTSE